MDIVKKPEYRAILDVVKNHLTDLAYPTIFLSFISVAAIIYLQILYLDNYLPYWLHLILTSYLLYLIYTPFHEGVHGNISSKYKWLNRLFGSISAFFYLHSFTQHKWSHLTHHKYANDPILDPDGLIQGKNLFTTIIKSFFLSIRLRSFLALLSPLFANLWILLLFTDVTDVSDPENIPEIIIKIII